MGNQIVNQQKKENAKKEFIEGAAGIEISTITTAMAIQNNTPHKLQIVETNNDGINNLPFMLEQGEIVSDSEKVVTIKAEDIKREQIAKRVGAKAELKTKREDGIIH